MVNNRLTAVSCNKVLVSSMIAHHSKQFMLASITPGLTAKNLFGDGNLPLGLFFANLKSDVV